MVPLARMIAVRFWMQRMRGLLLAKVMPSPEVDDASRGNLRPFRNFRIPGCLMACDPFEICNFKVAVSVPAAERFAHWSGERCATQRIHAERSFGRVGPYLPVWWCALNWGDRPCKMNNISAAALGCLLAITVLTSRAGELLQPAGPTLRSVYQDSFLIGVALDHSQVSGQNSAAAALAARQFSAVTAENHMKWEAVHPQPGEYRFDAADDYIRFAEENDMKVIGHTLVWHSQTPDWVFQGPEGREATREELLARMKEHIMTVAGRYKGRIHGWDVVNEALSDSGSDILRDSPWRRIIGDDFIDHAFRFAREAAPDAELYYNDYGLEDPRKRANCLKLVAGLIERGVPIDGIGTQSHFQLDYPSADEIEKTIEEFAALGLKVMVTELDVDVLPNRSHEGADIALRRDEDDRALDPHTDGLPEEMQGRLARRYADLFRIYLSRSDSIARVTFWGLDDGSTWLNNFPIRGRTNHPLLFDRRLEPKPAFFAVQDPRSVAGAP